MACAIWCGATGAAALLIVAVGVMAQPPLEWSEPVTVARVLTGDRIMVADGRVVRLAGIQVPGSTGPAADDRIERARLALKRLIASQAARLGTATAAYDRYGDLVAHLERAADGLWLQGALLEQGLVRVHTRPGETARAAEMLALERRARVARRGLWSDAAFATRRADDLAGAIGSFQIVRGRVHRVAPTERYLYLNFGRDWRTDFTVRVPQEQQKALRARFGQDIEPLEGREVEVRGFVIEAAGPLIALSHPEQLEVLE